MAKPRPDEKALAPWCIEQIRKWGGVLEHPKKSKLWPFMKLPEPGTRDEWGGFTIIAPQYWWGHLANKASKFYVCGCDFKNVPQIPFALGDAPMTVATNSKSRGKPHIRPEMKKEDREKTPDALAEWLVELARKCEIPIQKAIP
jgi:hypothetical protein